MNGALLALVLGGAAEILVPPWPLSRDGELVAVRGGAPLEATGARVTPVSPGLWRVEPEPAAREVELRGGGARRLAPVEAPPGEVRFEARPAAPVKGKDQAIALSVSVLGPDGRLDESAPPPTIASSSGRVRDLVADGPGRWRAVYEPSPARYPEVAVLIGLVPRCPLCPTPAAIGHAILPLAAAIELPGVAEPGVSTTLEIAGRSFGPAVADPRGRFRIPIVVPPGARFASATASDRVGNRKRSTVDLHLPEIDRLACLAWPPAIPADGASAASVHCVASGPGGEPAPGAALELSARVGTAGSFAPARGGLQRATYRAPLGGGGADAGLQAAFPAAGAASREAPALRLATGAPSEIRVVLARDPVPLGGATAAVLTVRDARGDPLGQPTGPAGATAGFVAPDRFVARATPDGWVQPAPLSFELPPGAEVATIALRRDGDDWVAEARTVDARPAVGAALRFGSGAEAITDGRGEARVRARGPAETVRAANGARAAGWEAVAPPSSPVAIERRVRVALRPRSAVEIVAGLQGRELRWRVEDDDGRALPGRPVLLRAAGVELGPEAPDGDGARCEVRGGRGTVAIVDPATGVSAVVEVP